MSRLGRASSWKMVACTGRSWVLNRDELVTLGLMGYDMLETVGYSWDMNMGYILTKVSVYLSIIVIQIHFSGNMKKHTSTKKSRLFTGIQ